ncbi:MAG: transposase [Ilumatobacteraceae bacterium]
MGRPLRTDIAGRRYHVVNRGVDRTTIFHDDRDRLEFERLLGVAHDRFGVTIDAYCWMTNHYHLVMECPDGGLFDTMHLIGSVYVRHTNERHGRDGPLFRERFYAKPILSEGYLLRLIRYVHRNPLAFVTPDELLGYRWSSLRSHLGLRRPPSWMNITSVRALCGGPDGVASLSLDEPRPVVGPAGPDAWMHAVELAIDDAPVGHGHARSSKTVATLLLDRLDSAQRDEVAELLDFPNPAAERAAIYRARRRLRDEPGLGALVDAAIDLAA